MLSLVFTDEPSVIPGMGPEDKIDIADSLPSFLGGSGGAIPGLDLDTSVIAGLTDDKSKAKKVPYAKPIPRNFQAQWNDTGKNDDGNFVFEQFFFCKNYFCFFSQKFKS